MDPEIEKHFSNPLRQAFVSSFEGARFVPASLFTKWFRELGVPYFFLFKKNLSCTNLQFAELLALARVHTTDILRRQRDLHFVTLREFLEQVSNTVSDLQPALHRPPEIVDAFLNLYSELLWSMVVVEPFYGSCTLFYPGHLSLDLFRVCSESGYVHSCGLNVYTRDLDEADEAGLATALEAHLHRYQTDHKAKTFFAVYAHEDFTQYDRDYAADLRDGLDDVKIFVDKYYLADSRFTSVLENIRKRMTDEIVVPAAGDYRSSHRAARKSGEIDPSHTAWLIIDRQLGNGPSYRGQKRFLVCYDQLYKNDNPFHIFDENKPGWVSHTTIPHTLAGAMINITRPWWPATGPVKLGDPFSGTGTIWLECTKLENVLPDCADIEPLSLLLSEDNLRFFGLPSNDLGQLLASLNTLLAELTKLRVPSNLKREPAVEIVNAYETSIDILEMLDLSSSSVTVSDEALAILVGETPLCRLLFYLSLRTFVRHFSALRRGSEEWTKGYESELKTLMKQIEQLVELKVHEESAALERQGRFVKFFGSYSVGTVVSTEWLAEAARSEKAWPRVSRGNAMVDNGSRVEVIITDPPYGFNTDSNTAELAKLYSEAIKRMLNRLEDEGQIVLCLADRSHTGRQIATFTTKSWVIHQIITEAQALGLEPIKEVQIAPEPGALFQAPYYWESERALRRAILHFRFRRRS